MVVTSTDMFIFCEFYLIRAASEGVMPPRHLGPQEGEGAQEGRALSLLVSLRKNPRVGCVTPRWAACLLGCSLGSGRRCEHRSGLGHTLTPGVGTGGRIHWLAGLGWEEVPQRKGCYFPREKNLAPSRKEHMPTTFLESVRRVIFITHYYP